MVLQQHEPIVDIRGAEKSFGSRRALRGISLQLFPGELLGFLGPNGAGKTTLIRCLAGRSRLDSGEIRLGTTRQEGEPILDHRAHIGFVPQSLAIYADLTVLQNLEVFGRLHAVRGRKLSERVESALVWAKLEDRVSQLAGTLSGGMQRRLNIACSVLHSPSILLLDEPTVGVDPQSRERIYDMLHELRQQGTAILLTTHQLDEAQYRCDRIAIVDSGRVVGLGTLEELVQNTVGSSQRLVVQFQKKQAAVPHPLALDSSGYLASCEIGDAYVEIGEVVAALSTAQTAVDQINVHAPTLQQVFLHLTGRELRE